MDAPVVAVSDALKKAPYERFSITGTVVKVCVQERLLFVGKLGRQWILYYWSESSSLVFSPIILFCFVLCVFYSSYELFVVCEVMYIDVKDSKQPLIVRLLNVCLCWVIYHGWPIRFSFAYEWVNVWWGHSMSLLMFVKTFYPSSPCLPMVISWLKFNVLCLSICINFPAIFQDKLHDILIIWPDDCEGGRAF